MFNPYISSAGQSLRLITGKGSTGSGLDGILRKLGNLDSDDLLILLLIYLLAKEGEQDGVWALVAAMLYLIL